jgi:hypothetical protein
MCPGIGLMLAQAPRSASVRRNPSLSLGAVGQEDLAWPDGVQHVGGASAVMGLAGRQLEHDRQAVGVD